MTDFSTLGHPGRWASVTNVVGAVLTGSKYIATGSQYGVGGMIISKSVPATGSVLLSNGGSIDLQELNAGTLYELSIQQLNVTGSVYLLRRNNYSSP